jgi:hypothetical protein
VPDQALGPAYETQATALNGETVDVLLIPFANLGRWYASDQEKTNDLKTGAGTKNGLDLRERIHPYAVWIPPA